MDSIFCDYCQDGLSGLLIRCLECTDFDLCLQCFSSGVECGSHKKDHKYRIENVINSLVFETERAWNLTEEHKLLDAVEEFGFGNWTEVAGHVKTRTAEECEEHFSTYYVSGNIGKATFPSEPSYQIPDHSCHDGGPVSPSNVRPLPPLDLSAQEQHDLGFMSLRNDFEREYNNAAETLVSGLAISTDDDELDIVKLCCLSKFRMQLHERLRRKRIARSHQLISSSLVNGKNGKTPNAKRKCIQENGDLMEQVKVFTQLQTSEEHERLQETLSEEKVLKTKIEHLSELRKQGLTERSDIVAFEAQIEQEKQKKSRKNTKHMSSPRSKSMVAKKSEGKVEKLGILIDDDDTKDDEGLTEGSREMACMPGYEVLSKREKRLCNSLKLVPATYMTIKTSIIEDCLKRKEGVPSKIRFPSGMDKTHRRRILSFLSDNGWIGLM